MNEKYSVAFSLVLPRQLTSITLTMRVGGALYTTKINSSWWTTKEITKITPPHIAMAINSVAVNVHANFDKISKIAVLKHKEDFVLNIINQHIFFVDLTLDEMASLCVANAITSFDVDVLENLYKKGFTGYANLSKDELLNKWNLIDKDSVILNARMLADLGPTRLTRSMRELATNADNYCKFLELRVRLVDKSKLESPGALPAIFSAVYNLDTKQELVDEINYLTHRCSSLMKLAASEGVDLSGIRPSD